MAGAIAHHFNNQLFAIMGSLELVMEQASGRALERHLRIAMDSLGIKTRGKQRLDASGLCRKTLPMLLAIKPAQVRLETTLPAQGPELMTNADQLREVLCNLLENA